MKTYIDTNILYYKHSGRKHDLKIKDKKITSINALEFLKNIEKKHTNKAKYHIPRINSEDHYRALISNKDFFKKRNQSIHKRHSDFIKFDFAQDFDSYALYNNESISQVINNEYKDLFYMATSLLEKSEFKDLKARYNFILGHNLECESINKDDILLAYELLDKFLKSHSLKNDFRNCWNDILILAKSINEGAKLISSDKLLNRFASESYSGKIQEKDDLIEIQFPEEKENLNKYTNQESKGFINRGWDYKIRKGIK